MDTLKLKTSKNQYDSARTYFLDDKNRLFCIYNREPNYFLSATKDGEPFCNLKHGLKIVIDDKPEQLNINPNSL
jgi:hypothetical protein